MASSALRIRTVKNSIISNKLSAGRSTIAADQLKDQNRGGEPTLVHGVDISEASISQPISVVVSIDVLR